MLRWKFVNLLLNLPQVLSLPAVVAPTKVLIVPLSAREEFDPIVQDIREQLLRAAHCK
jgi:glycyl-tRNA synthetase (class II)